MSQALTPVLNYNETLDNYREYNTMYYIPSLEIQNCKKADVVNMFGRDIGDYEPPSGVIARRAPKGMPRYNMHELMTYCKENNVKPMDMSTEEKRRFEIPR